MNKVIVIGRLVKDPELKYAPSSGTAICNFNLAVNRYRKEKEVTSFIPCTVFGKQAENLAQYMSKGKRIGIEGELETSNYEAADGSKRFSMTVIVNRIEFLDKVGGESTGSADNSNNNGGFNDFDYIQDSGDMPW